MKHFVLGEYDEMEKEVKTEHFFSDLEELFKQYNISISHQDGHGSFILEKYDTFNLEWLKEASVSPEVRDHLNK